MNPTLTPSPAAAKVRRRRPAPLLVWCAAGILVTAVIYASYIAAAWLTFGRVAPHPNALLDSFMPQYDVVEHHDIVVHAPADIAFDVARHVRLEDSPLVRAVLFVRTLPSRFGGRRASRIVPVGLVDQTIALGWGVLAEAPQQIVMGAVTEPWAPVVEFDAVPPSAFRDYARPRAAKIVWTIAAVPITATESRVWTETRVVATDPEARRRFRRYWSVVSPGVLLIRFEALRLVRAESERRMARGSGL